MNFNVLFFLKHLRLFFNFFFKFKFIDYNLYKNFNYIATDYIIIMKLKILYFNSKILLIIFYYSNNLNEYL